MSHAIAPISAVTLRPSTRQEAAELVSVVVPVVDRADDLLALYDTVREELGDTEFELLFVFDGGAPPVPPALSVAARTDPQLRVYRFDQAFGEATVLRAGFERSRGMRIVTISAYFQVRPEGIRGVLRALDEGSDLVVTRRWPRADGWFNRLQSSAFHAIVHRVSGIGFRDMACGLRGMRREVAEGIPLYGDMHRFIPALAMREGFRVVELDVPQHPSDARPRVYGPGVYVRRLLDIIAFFFLAKFTEKPLRFFGLVGATLAAAGALISSVLLVQRLTGQGIANRPLLLLGALMLAIGVQVIGLGLVGEIIVHLRAPHRRSYRIRESL